MKCLQIKPINHGIACRIGSNIYYNKKLEFYPELLKAIMKHENKHSDNFTTEDILLDVENKEIKGHKKQYYHFLFTTLSAWTELLPCWKYEGQLVWNPLITITWLVAIFGSWLIAILLNV